LVQFYASSEMAQRMVAGVAATRETTVEAPSSGVQQASAMARPDADARPTVGLSRDDRLRRAKLLGQYLEKSRPSLYADPSVRFPLVVAERALGFTNPAARYFLTLHQLPARDPWRRCAETEQWFAQPDGSPPPKTLGSCRHVSERPHLDGKLTETFWKSAERLPLKATDDSSTYGEASEDAASADKNAPKDARRDLATVRFACDSEFLYFAVGCPKAHGVDYSPADGPRPRDADLSEHDRVTLKLDTDRDYTTAFEVTVDDRGWTHDACWGDASWDPTWYVAAASDDRSWTVEGAIPLAELVAQPPAAKEVWAVGIRRTIPKVGYESWPATPAEVDSPDEYGLLIFQ
jgi:hypothetical protein